MTDPYKLLGVPRTATDAEVRAAYRKLVKATHPDHNGGSPEAARRFEAVQQAYAEIQELRRSHAEGAPPRDPDLESRMADLENQVREAQRARERAQRAAREAMRTETTAAERSRPTDEELGYITTDDTFSKILTDARNELTERYAHAREHPVVQRVSDLIEGLEDLVEKLDRPPRAK